MLTPLIDPTSYTAIRNRTVSLIADLEPEDLQIQTFPEASPGKWHMAHTTWFFERLILMSFMPSYRVPHPEWHRIFNSYYHSQGQLHPRNLRGILNRPLLKEVLAWRTQVDAAMLEFIGQQPDTEVVKLIELGLQHEQQHQELLLMDLHLNLSAHPLLPTIKKLPTGESGKTVPLTFLTIEAWETWIGAQNEGFSFDNEHPRHRVYLHPFQIANRLITQQEFSVFIKEGGYNDPLLWLDDGWSWRMREYIDRPLYWQDDLQSTYTLSGTHSLDPHAPVAHISYFEADAFARWAGARLPTEAEWEHIAAHQSGILDPNEFVESGFLTAKPAINREGLQQFFGGLWEWTSSPYTPYPGYRPPAGAIAEYNGKFMCNQMVLRGGSCLTPMAHFRISYRNFFYPHQRWVAGGIRLAQDA